MHCMPNVSSRRRALKVQDSLKTVSPLYIMGIEARIGRWAGTGILLVPVASTGALGAR